MNPMILRPTKHSHPDKTVIAVSALIVERLRSKRTERYDELRRSLIKSHQGTDTLFLPSLTFLYLMGVLEYHPKTDSFEYIG